MVRWTNPENHHHSGIEPTCLLSVPCIVVYTTSRSILYVSRSSGLHGRVPTVQRCAHAPPFFTKTQLAGSTAARTPRAMQTRFPSSNHRINHSTASRGLRRELLPRICIAPQKCICQWKRCTCTDTQSTDTLENLAGHKNTCSLKINLKNWLFAVRPIPEVTITRSVFICLTENMLLYSGPMNLFSISLKLANNNCTQIHTKRKKREKWRNPVASDTFN